ncbi:MAG: CoA transferase [Terracidiphilus sp.]|jgi:crotonobetainyl-CoA:carnitine CoA-transferase CaiB-like acyl-CoA transferase
MPFIEHEEGKLDALRQQLANEAAGKKEASRMTHALDGVTVLDFTQLLQGPYATQMMGDLGADVIKIEKLGSGDIYRQMTFFNSWIGDGESPCFLAWNRNKRSIALDIKSAAGKEIVLKLARKADVLVENFRPGVMGRLGFGYSDIEKINPRIIYCSASGWGRDGPYVSRPGQDILVQGLSGVALTSGRADAGPVMVGTGLCDQLGGLHVVYGVLAALYHREKSGRGQEIQVNLLASAVALQMQDFMTVLNLGRSFERPNSGIAHPGNGAPFGTYATSDGFISIAMNPWSTVVEALGAPELMRYDDPQVLFDRRDTIWQEIQSIVSNKTTAEWLGILLKRDLWAGEVKPQSRIPDDPQVRHLNLFTTVDHPKAGRIRSVNMPLQFSETPGSIRRPPPLVGQHGREILGELGYSETEIAKLCESGVVSMEETKPVVETVIAHPNG